MGQPGRIAIPAAAWLAAGIAAPSHAQSDEFYMADMSSGSSGATLTLEWHPDDADDQDAERFCYTISAYGGLTRATGAELRRGAGGPVVMAFDPPGGRDDASDGCLTPDPGLREAIAANPAAYFASIEGPSGAISGPLER